MCLYFWVLIHHLLTSFLIGENVHHSIFLSLVSACEVISLFSDRQLFPTAPTLQLKFYFSSCQPWTSPVASIFVTGGLSLPCVSPCQSTSPETSAFHFTFQRKYSAVLNTHHFLQFKSKGMQIFVSPRAGRVILPFIVLQCRLYNDTCAPQSLLVSRSEVFPLLIFHNQTGSMPLLTRILFGAHQKPSWGHGGVPQGNSSEGRLGPKDLQGGCRTTAQPEQGWDKNEGSCKCLLYRKSSQLVQMKI